MFKKITFFALFALTLISGAFSDVTCKLACGQVYQMCLNHKINPNQCAQMYNNCLASCGNSLTEAKEVPTLSFLEEPTKSDVELTPVISEVSINQSEAKKEITMTELVKDNLKSCAYITCGVKTFYGCCPGEIVPHDCYTSDQCLTVSCFC